MGAALSDMDGVRPLRELGTGDLLDGASRGVVSFLSFNNIAIGFASNFKAGHCWYSIGRLSI